MSARVAIPVSANSIGTHVRVQAAATLDGDNPPAPTSLLWQTVELVPNGDLPTTVLTHPMPRGTALWSRASADEGGLRVSAYTTPVVTLVPLLPGFTATALIPGPPHEVTWTPNAETGGVRVRWSVQPIGSPAVFDESDEVDAADESYEIADVVPLGSRLTVQIRALEGLESVDDGPWIEGQIVTLEFSRPSDSPTPVGPDPLDALACRIVLDEDGSPVWDEDYCLVLSEPE